VVGWVIGALTGVDRRLKVAVPHLSNVDNVLTIHHPASTTTNSWQAGLEHRVRPHFVQSRLQQWNLWSPERPQGEGRG